MLKKIVLVAVVALFITSCGGSKKAARKKAKVRSTEIVIKAEPTETPAETQPETEVAVETAPVDNVAGYINAYAEIAKEEMRQYGIPASITLAQAVLESGAGRGELTRKANNHFGIKCHDWKGAVVYHDDDEKGECFRKYKDPKFSFRDHSLFLTGRQRYNDLFKLRKDDYEGWAKGLRAAGYATDRKYPEKLIAIIENYKLYSFDEEVLGTSGRSTRSNSAASAEEEISKYTVQKGETLYAIARKHNLTVETLKKYNGLTDNTIFEGQVLYVKPINKG